LQIVHLQLPARRYPVTVTAYRGDDVVFWRCVWQPGKPVYVPDGLENVTWVCHPKPQASQVARFWARSYPTWDERRWYGWHLLAALLRLARR
jgi:hypothetical protein